MIRLFIESFLKKLESTQYNAASAFTEAIRGTSNEQIYSELGLESLLDRRCSEKYVLFIKYEIVCHLNTQVIQFQVLPKDILQEMVF